MNRLTIVLLFAAAVSVSACGGGGASGDGRNASSPVGTDATVALANTMIAQATAEDCPTEAHCEVWPVETLVQVTSPEDQDPVDL